MDRVYSLESISGCENESFAATMKEFGFCIVSLDGQPSIDRCLQWESVFASAFDSTQEIKAISPYRSVCNGLAVGYRQDDEREFLETRVTCSEQSDSAVNSIDPLLPTPSTEEYRDFVLQLWQLLRDIGHKAVACMCAAIGVDPCYAWRLMDPIEITDTYSSSVIRICSYPACTPSETLSVAFGAHTDTSFVTVAPCSSVPGLQMRFPDGTWRSVEDSRSNVVVFAGEIMQILTRHHYRAAVHRVVCSSSRRISCPLIIRGYPKALLTPPDDNMYNHGNLEAALAVLSNLEGVTMKHIHKILDLRRARCRKQHEGDEGDWVLCAYENATETNSA